MRSFITRYRQSYEAAATRVALLEQEATATQLQALLKEEHDGPATSSFEPRSLSDLELIDKLNDESTLQLSSLKSYS